jgi:hypothetical protein
MPRSPAHSSGSSRRSRSRTKTSIEPLVSGVVVGFRKEMDAAFLQQPGRSLAG